MIFATCSTALSGTDLIYQGQKILCNEVKSNTPGIKATLGHNYHIHTHGHFILMQAQKGSKDTLHPITTNGVSDLAAYGKATTPCTRTVLTPYYKNNEIPGKIATTCIVAGYIVRSSGQTIGTSQHYADSFVLPLALLRRKMVRPAGLLERARNPWVLFRRILLG